MNSKITKATVRVMNSYKYGNFESSLTIENESGIDPQEIDELGLMAQDQVNTFVENYKSINEVEVAPQFTKTPFKPAKQVINVNAVPASDGSEIGVKDNATISEIANLPPYTKHKNA